MPMRLALSPARALSGVVLQQKQLELEDALQRQKHAEDSLRQARIEHEDLVRLSEADYQARLRGMLPLSVKNDLETTIDALKEQTTALEMRSSLLQGHIDSTYAYSNGGVSRF